MTSASVPHRRALSLRARLLGLASLATAGLLAGAFFVQLHITGSAMEREALDTARVTALGVAADLTERSVLPTPIELEDLRTQFAETVPAVRALTLTRIVGDQSVIDTSTDPPPISETLRLVQQAIGRREPVVSDELPGHLRLVAVPLETERHPRGAVVVTMSMESVARVRRESRNAALAMGVLTILALLAVLDRVGRRFVYAPLASLRETMRLATADDLRARAEVHRADEMGALALGLNAMLDRLADFNATLQEEIGRATGVLQERNRLLADSAQRLFAARGELARTEQLASAGQMAASVAHQIGTPLNLISGYVQMILEDLDPQSPAAARLRTVQEQIGRVTVIVQGLLDSARRPSLKKRPVPANEFLSAVIELARPSIEQAGIRIETRVDAGLPEIDVDLGQLEQVFLNLVTNAIDAMPGGGTLTLGARRTGAQIEFDVADSGHGIPAADKERIFDPMFTTKEPGKGTGLGLPIVHEILSAHGGTVSVTSAPGQGTRVTVTLPIDDRGARRSA